MKTSKKVPNGPKYFVPTHRFRCRFVPATKDGKQGYVCVYAMYSSQAIYTGETVLTLDEFYTKLQKLKVMRYNPPGKLARLLERSRFGTGSEMLDFAGAFRTRRLWLPILR